MGKPRVAHAVPSSTQEALTPYHTHTPPVVSGTCPSNLGLLVKASRSRPGISTGEDSSSQATLGHVWGSVGTGGLLCAVQHPGTQDAHPEMGLAHAHHTRAGTSPCLLGGPCGPCCAGLALCPREAAAFEAETGETGR